MELIVLSWGKASEGASRQLGCILWGSWRNKIYGLPLFTIFKQRQEIRASKCCWYSVWAGDWEPTIYYKKSDRLHCLNGVPRKERETSCQRVRGVTPSASGTCLVSLTLQLFSKLCPELHISNKNFISMYRLSPPSVRENRKTGDNVDNLQEDTGKTPS